MPDSIDLPRSGSLFIGEKGNLVLPHVGGPRLYPVENFTGFAYPKDIKDLNHYHRWIDAIVEGTQTSDNFDYAGSGLRPPASGLPTLIHPRGAAF